VNSVAVQLPWRNVRQISVPYLVGVLRQCDASGFLLSIHGVEQTQFDFGGIFGEQRKVYARAIPRSAERIGTSWTDSHAFVVNLLQTEQASRDTQGA